MNMVEEQRRLIEGLERRLTRCEEAVGGGYDAGQLKAASGGGAEAGGGRGAASAMGSSLVMMTCRLHHELSKICRGNLQDLQDSYRQLKVWLECDQSAVSKLLLTLQAKRMYVLQHEEMLRTTAAHVRQMQELEEYINPVDLAELDSYNERLRVLNERGNLLAERAARAEERLLEIAQVYNSTVTLMAALFEEWHQYLTDLEEAATKGTSGGADGLTATSTSQ